MATPSTFAPTSYQQGWTKYAFDQRTFGDLVSAVIDELDKPNLQQPAILAAQDAVRFWRRKPLFYTERDNRSMSTFGWVAGMFWSMGATIKRTVGLVDYAFVACTEGFSGMVEPTWPATILTPPQWGILIDNTLLGAVQDNQVVWANAGLWSGATQSSVQTGGYDQYGRSRYWTQLSMVPNLNQYRLPLDFVSPVSIRVTVNGIRYPIEWFPYERYSILDIVQPPPLGNYPSQYTYTEQDLLIWQYPNQFSPMLLIYKGPDQPPEKPTDINMWTTVGARLIKLYAKGILNKEVIRDAEAAVADMSAADEEFSALELEGIGKTITSGIPPEEW